MTTINKDIKNYISNLSADEVISLWNAYCEQNNDSDSKINLNDEEFWDNFYTNKSPYDIIVGITTSNNNIKYNDDYVSIDGYGNPYTFSKRNFMSFIDVDEISKMDIDDFIDLCNDANIDMTDFE